jgi:catechol 2,3-dioxygenase-like lactoylglutathione lyase family enzyme
MVCRFIQSLLELLYDSRGAINMAVKGIKDKTLAQVCIIVKDLESAMQKYADILGFNLPEIQETLLHDHTEATYHGKPTDARARLVCFEIGKIQFELLQPLDPPSAWMDFLQKHGDGIHHVAFFVPDTQTAVESFAEHGYTVTHQGLFTGRTGMYTYLDTDRDMGIVIELLEHFDGSPQLSAPPFPADKGIGTDIVCQVGIIVHDIEKTAQRYVDVLGVPKPPIQVTKGYDVTRTTYRGQPSEATAKLAFLDFGQVQIELIEPDEKPSVWRDYLNEKGEGAQHIAFVVKNTGEVTGYLAKAGIPIAQQALYSSGGGMYTYMDSDAALGTTVELLENF